MAIVHARSSPTSSISIVAHQVLNVIGPLLERRPLFGLELVPDVDTSDTRQRTATVV